MRTQSFDLHHSCAGILGSRRLWRRRGIRVRAVVGFALDGFIPDFYEVSISQSQASCCNPDVAGEGRFCLDMVGTWVVG